MVLLPLWLSVVLLWERNYFSQVFVCKKLFLTHSSTTESQDQSRTEIRSRSRKKIRSTALSFSNVFKRISMLLTNCRQFIQLDAVNRKKLDSVQQIHILPSPRGQCCGAEISPQICSSLFGFRFQLQQPFIATSKGKHFWLDIIKR